MARSIKICIGAIAAAFALSACATFDPGDPRDDIAAVELGFYGSLVAVAQAADAGIIDKDTAETLIPIIDAIAASIESAHEAFDNDDLIEAARFAELARQKIREVGSILRQRKEENPLTDFNLFESSGG